MIRIAPALTAEHDRVLTDYLRGASNLTRERWHELRAAVEVLGRSVITWQGRDYTFRQFCETFVDRPFGEPFLRELTASTDVIQEAPRLRAAVARQIVQWTRAQEFYQQGQRECRWLLTFCLYWWAAFAIGYAFEIEICRDLRTAGVSFACHDVTNRAERVSPFDLTVAGFRGDVKYSTYFLTGDDARTEGIDFFITRLYDEDRANWLRVVILTPPAWGTIDGETPLVPLEQIAAVLPAAASVQIGTKRFVVTLYDDWKARVLSRQRDQGEQANGGEDARQHGR